MIKSFPLSLSNVSLLLFFVKFLKYEIAYGKGFDCKLILFKILYYFSEGESSTPPYIFRPV